MWQLLNLCVGPIFTPEKKSEKGMGMFLMYCEILNTPIFYQYSCQQEWVIESKYAQRFYMNFRYSLPTDTQYHCYWNFLLKYAEFILESELKNLNWLKYTCEFSFVLFFPFPFLFFTANNPKIQFTITTDKKIHTIKQLESRNVLHIFLKK